MKDILKNHPIVIDYIIVRERIGRLEGLIEINVELISNHQLVIFEYYKEKQVTDYRYQIVKEHGELLVRWDNTPHFPDIKTFPHHKHIQHRVVESVQPNLMEILEELTEIW